ncbi:bifunctional DNA-formamidopyrimidine glycosylase/DNA-(apurinic or apyrimidinic site) lyase [Desulfoferrobacter suflitae]|uniref:bifunctional DNA-formamidopyrimidine glycosylase/DNA-(apurinic or apyrimidinic site) lyase n=1 Tax=Desulfoferrobacter suflitae TaxID=2865782 RepID=UPI0021647516|nr:bifunctional DNA-formamidopyrimidine glycosylase/DNA-(apurinic or apyrimidinic site) lyase [Desulfoferrobacter suflitae]MCK8602076.1 bifunctional DNA-formamidopyrimidine glycosylase/DNA-(apurinic or apyrimidinic site) lyase [Desulfoferrobacter suflitae]
MPELPEVETIRRCIAPEITGQTVTRVIVRNAALRWPVPVELARSLPGQRVIAVERRAKYLLIQTEGGTLIMHLGMSGTLLVRRNQQPADKHDHLDLVFGNGKILRFNDPRRFGCALWTTEPPDQHPLLAALGKEPLEDGLTAQYLYEQSRGRALKIKEFLMNSRIVSGIGNIYANESLFAAGIHPNRAAGRISLKRYERLTNAIKKVLVNALQQGGTTLRDFCDASGKPGYFQLQLMVYDRAGAPCRICGSAIRRIRSGQRSTYFCRMCQR